ncbi:zinc finger BED domain-containing protein RICESLEEPER 2-like [Rhizophagus clarus]|uniref:Zinc finger BED domain-containing protein RICESLEEPER 2-like n=1 Tax=Rhizophagus clarus TaxID=94130 RepID=A0A8H3KQ29_9GLOM|nr:zinc finger BED domain-containing protein RICESLEEPER 2-like [Rhizophagus clarus]
MSDSLNYLDDVFILNIDDINDENDETSRKTSSLWTYVDCKNPAHPGVPVCKRCNFVFSVKSSNTALERHLLNKHNITIPKVRKQTTLKFKCTDPWPEKEKLERDHTVIIWIISNQQPFSIVINEFDSHRKNVIYDLQKIPGKVSFTADIWTSTLSSEAYLGLTIHYIDQNWVLQHFLLDITSFKTHHTGINMATEITKVLHEFKLVGKAMAITTDNESAMLVCGQKLAEEFEREMDDFSFNHYRCSAHILNLAVKQGMEIIDKEILDVRKLMAKIKNSVLLCDDLRELCIMEKLEYLRPEIDVETRWNSTYYMLCKLQQMETALKMLAIKHEGVRNLMPNAEA